MKINSRTNRVYQLACGLALIWFNGQATAQTPGLVLQPDLAGYPWQASCARAPIVVDLNNDGRDDIIIPQTFSPDPKPLVRFDIRLTNPDGTAGPSTYLLTNIYGCGFTAAKMTPGSNNKSIVVFNADDAYNNGVRLGKIAIIPGNGDGTFGAPQFINGSFLGGGFGVLTPLDVSGAGYAKELLTVGNDGLKVYSRNQQDGSYATVPFFTTSDVRFDPYQLPFVADFNGDGRDDLMVQIKDSSNNLVRQIYLGGGTADNPTLTPQTPLGGAIGNAVNISLTPDVNGDGKPDFLVDEIVSFVTTFSIALNDGAGNPSLTVMPITTPTMSAGIPIRVGKPLFADMDGDGATDLVWGAEVPNIINGQYNSDSSYQILYQKGIKNSNAGFGALAFLGEAPWTTIPTSFGLSAITTNTCGKKSVLVQRSTPIGEKYIYNVFLNPASTGTTMSLGLIPLNATAGLGISITATMAGSAAGNVAFSDGNIPLGSASIVNGMATLTLPAGLSVGNHSISATYSGNACSGGSNAIQTIAVGKAKTQNILSVVADDLDSGSPVVLTSKVTGFNPTGTAVFVDERGNEIGQASLINGTAALSIILPKGKYLIKATYLGDSSNLASSSNQVEIKVKKFKERKAKLLPDSASLATRAGDFSINAKRIFYSWTSSLRNFFFSGFLNK